MPVPSGGEADMEVPKLELNLELKQMEPVPPAAPTLAAAPASVTMAGAFTHSGMTQAFATNAAAAPEPTGVWNFDQQVPTMSVPSSVIVHDVHVQASPQRKVSPAVLAASGLLLAVVSWFGFNWFAEGKDPMAAMDELIALVSGAEPVAPAPVAHKPEKKVADAKPQEPQEVAKAVDEPQKPAHSSKAGETSEHPYGELKNMLAGSPLPHDGAMTAEQEAARRKNLESKFQYQRYKAVVDTANERPEGGEDILRSGLASGKFWMRMRAVIGLADFGATVTADDIKVALGDAHPELKARFFARFERGTCSVGCYFIARGAMEFLEPVGRRQLAKVISREGSAEGNAWMVAATFDKDEEVRTIATRWLLEHPVEEAEWWRVHDLAMKSQS